MGQFSWLCACCDEQILSEGEDWECFKCEELYRGKEAVVLVTPDGNDFHEEDYEGYGVFGGIDAYSWLARINGCSDRAIDDESDEDREMGIDLHFKSLGSQRLANLNITYPLKYPIKIVHKRCLSQYKYLSASEDDPNQGWQQMTEEGNLTLCEDCANGW